MGLRVAGEGGLAARRVTGGGQVGGPHTPVHPCRHHYTYTWCFQKFWGVALWLKRLIKDIVARPGLCPWLCVPHLHLLLGAPLLTYIPSQCLVCICTHINVHKDCSSPPDKARALT